MRIGWVGFGKCGELLLGNGFPLGMKGEVCGCCMGSAMRAMCCQKVVDRKMTEEQMDMLDLKETLDQLAIANGVRWYGHVLKMDGNSVLRVALNLEVTGKRKRGRLKRPGRSKWRGRQRRLV